MIYEAKVGPVEVSHWISRGICLAVLAACCTLGSDVCITLLTLRFPLQHPAPPPPQQPPPALSTVHLWSLSFPPPSICTSAFHWGPHVSEDLNTLNAGTSKVSLWHLTQRLGDLKGRGENYRRWSVTKIKNRPRLPPITLNNAVQAICWSDGGLVLSVEDCRKERDSFRETGT